MLCAVLPTMATRVLAIPRHGRTRDLLCMNMNTNMNICTLTNGAHKKRFPVTEHFLFMQRTTMATITSTKTVVAASTTARSSSSTAREYYNVKQDEFEPFMVSNKFFRNRDINGVNELVYDQKIIRHKQLFIIRIFSSINPNGNSRGSGLDRIRVVVFHDEKPFGSTKQVNRLRNWQNNLSTKMKQAIAEVLETKICPRCGRPMVKRKNCKDGEMRHFWGCTGFPRHCEFTVSIM
jgi:hypothetical protein